MKGGLKIDHEGGVVLGNGLIHTDSKRVDVFKTGVPHNFEPIKNVPPHPTHRRRKKRE